MEPLRAKLSYLSFVKAPYVFGEYLHTSGAKFAPGPPEPYQTVIFPVIVADVAVNSPELLTVNELPKAIPSVPA